jgi:hypothetical protein
MTRFFTRYWYIVLITFAGIAGGYIYWRYVGCSSGSCPITSKWHMSSIFGGLLGFFTADMVRDFLKKRKT